MTLRHADPAETRVPSGDQEHRSRFFSKLCECPCSVLTHRCSGAYGRMSHKHRVLSIELDTTNEPSGLRASPEMLSKWPIISYTMSSFRRSYTLTTFSIPPKIIWLDDSLKTAESIWNLSLKLMAKFLLLVSHTLTVQSSDAVTRRDCESGEAEQLLTTAEWPFNFLIRVQDDVSHTTTVLSALDVNVLLPSDEKQTSKMAALCVERAAMFSHSPYVFQ